MVFILCKMSLNSSGWSHLEKLSPWLIFLEVMIFSSVEHILSCDRDRAIAIHQMPF